MTAMAVDALQSRSRTHGSVAHSSAEAEVYAVVSGVNEALCAASLMSELGFDGLTVQAFTDSSAAKAAVERPSGTGRMKHVILKYMYVRERLENTTIQIKKIPSASNVADILTKAIEAGVLNGHLEWLGIRLLVHQPRSEQSSWGIWRFNVDRTRLHVWCAYGSWSARSACRYFPSRPPGHDHRR